MFAKKTISRTFSVLSIMVCMAAVTPLQTAQAANVRYARPDGTGDCSSWGNACTLQTALNGAVSGNEIWVAAGTYKPTTDPTDRDATFQLINGVALYGGFTGSEKTPDQRNPAANLTILSGDLIGDDVGFIYNAENVYHVVTGTTGATLDGFIITAGNANGDYSSSGGGGMYNDSSDPTLANVTFNGNTAGGVGGGMYNHNSDPTMTNVTFSSNTACCGGGMYNGSSSPTLTNVTFNSNSAYVGGGMLNEVSSDPTLTNVTFSSNSAGTYGGGMYNHNGDPMLTNVTFSGNSATDGGGGMFNELNSNPTLINVTFSGNSAGYYGGGMYNTPGGNPTLTNVTFSSNSSSQYGGGIYNYSSSPALTNVTFSDNTAIIEGGGMYNYNNSNPQIHNTIFWVNTAGFAGAQVYNSDSTSSPGLSFSVVQDGCPEGSTCTNIITAEPMLGTLGNYGGFTQTIPLLPGSSAIDTGDDAVCPATDQRGIPRPQGAHCDIGAFEVLSSTPGFSLFLPFILR